MCFNLLDENEMVEWFNPTHFIGNYSMGKIENNNFKQGWLVWLWRDEGGSVWFGLVLLWMGGRTWTDGHVRTVTECRELHVLDEVYT